MINREKFLSLLISKLDDTKGQTSPRSVAVEKVILFILDKLRKGNFRGIISIKIYDGEVYSPRIDQLETVIESDYQSLDEG